ncbi:MAG: HAD family hydrolase [Ardenticatenaceae bacterium]|nr:HAD family hydrolase [Ardenticatenaceae bacterium]MCB8991647.1 HAD family hydrolase [Ardenticatenaceae bacterium]MCB9002744.1 HAD family hydrolase [Ardenticatenaceae bacterium]
MFDIIAFDADDTLWHNERDYRRAAARLQTLLAPYQGAAVVAQTLLDTETRNLEGYGYGLKAFALSMIETAVSLSNGQISGSDILQIIHAAKEMIATDVELLPGVAETLATLAPHHRLMIITKGDLLDQERKLTRSGLGDVFTHFEVVSHKTPQTYRDLLARYDIAPQHFMMIGNSLRSDVLPVVEIGGTAVHIPHALTWEYEADVDHTHHHNGYYELPHINDLPTLLQQIAPH